jgi:magnesium transporter
VTDLAEGYRELVTSVLDAYLSTTSNRLNEIMKFLTLISTIMLPLSLIAGIYGMNFEFMPELHLHYGYGIALGAMVATAVGLVWYFRRRKWL